MLKHSQENNFKATFRSSLRTVFFLLSIIVNSTLVFGQTNLQLDHSNFDKKKWLSSSDYRYEIVKSNYFPSLDFSLAPRRLPSLAMFLAAIGCHCQCHCLSAAFFLTYAFLCSGAAAAPRLRSACHRTKHVRGGLTKPQTEALRC